MNKIEREMYQLCLEIEQLSASEKQTNLSIHASEIRDEIGRLEALGEFHPRAAKLMAKGKNFLVVAEDEPYFLQVYSLIRDWEILNGTWSPEDGDLFRAAIAKFRKKMAAPSEAVAIFQSKF